MFALIGLVVVAGAIYWVVKSDSDTARTIRGWFVKS